MTRRAPNLTTKLASALIEVQRLRCDPIDHADHLTPAQICSLFHFDHVVWHSILDGSMHPTNLKPLLIAEHRRKTARIDIPAQAKLKRGLAKRAGQKRKSKPIPGSRDTRFKKKLNGQVEIRT